MRTMRCGRCFAVALLVSPAVCFAGAYAADLQRRDRPNIVVILADDLGYADLGCQGSKEAVTPQIDSIAANGVRCTAGYVSAPQCCPSRAGLITGRYQNRFGFEANWAAPAAGKAGLPPGEPTIADRLKAAGYVTGMIGKWHLGNPEPMRPYRRGFDETFWHPNGGVLLPDKETGFIRNLYRGPHPVQVAEYSTDAFGREASEFIERHRREPFFLYLAFVPPHWPMEAKPEHLAQFADVRDLHRRTMLAMMASLDENVGRVLAKLREAGLEENTLVFFLSDNGGPTGRPRPNPDAPFEIGQNTSRNDPCRGVKGDLLEGGIRVPFLVQWKGRIPAGKTYDEPVISLDILPTALAAAGAEPRPDWNLDGADLLPFLTGKRQGAPHEALYWRFRFPPAQPARHRWAIRQGPWKLVKNDLEPLALYHLANDVGEKTNLAAAQPERVRAMKAAWKRWDAELKEPLWTEPAVRGGRTFRNPVIKANLADPTVVFHEGRYYLYATGDVNGDNGYRAYTSTDLVSWQRGPVVFQPGERHVWAPDVWRDPGSGRFYLYYTANSAVGVAAADGPLGPFTSPRKLFDSAIDAHLFRDDDGRLYLYFVKLPGFRITVQPMRSPTEPLGEARVVLQPESEWEKRAGQVTEGPWLIRRGGRYYLIYSGSGADTPDYAVGYATSASPLGPFQRAAHNPILCRSEGVFGPGHGCAIQDRAGRWWYVYHQKSTARREWDRFICLDPLRFDAQGRLFGAATRGVEQPLPATTAP